MIEAILVITWDTKPKSKTSGTVLYQLASGASFTFLSLYGKSLKAERGRVDAAAAGGDLTQSVGKILFQIYRITKSIDR